MMRFGPFRTKGLRLLLGCVTAKQLHSRAPKRYLIADGDKGKAEPEVNATPHADDDQGWISRATPSPQMSSHVLTTS